MIEKQLVREYPKQTKVSTAGDIFELCDDIRDSEIEVIAAFLLDIRLKVIRREIISIGDLYNNLVSSREIFKRAIAVNAAAVILVHNHPSGDTSPSDEDIEITKRLVEGGKLLQLPIKDHIIVCKEAYQSIINEA